MEHVMLMTSHDDVIKWKDFPRYWPFVRGINRSPMDSPHKGKWSGTLMYSLICAWTNGWAKNRCVGDLRRHCAHYDVIIMDISRHWVNGIFSQVKFFVNPNLYQVYNPDNKVQGANMGPIWGRQDPGGPHVGPMNFVIWESDLDIDSLRRRVHPKEHEHALYWRQMVVMAFQINLFATKLQTHVSTWMTYLQ